MGATGSRSIVVFRHPLVRDTRRNQTRIHSTLQFLRTRSNGLCYSVAVLSISCGSARVDTQQPRMQVAREERMFEAIVTTRDEREYTFMTGLDGIVTVLDGCFAVREIFVIFPHGSAEIVDNGAGVLYKGRNIPIATPCRWSARRWRSSMYRTSSCRGVAKRAGNSSSPPLNRR